VLSAQAVMDDVPSAWRPHKGRLWSFRWSFPEAALSATESHHLDSGLDLTSENGTLRDGTDGGGLTSNP
jgi:hypothetical protein